MIVNQPLLLGGGAGSPGAGPLTGSAQACITPFAVGNTFTLNPADHITGLQDGDYVLMVCVMDGTSGSCLYANGWTTYAFTTTTSIPVERNCAVIGGFWDSGSPTTTFTLVRFSTAALCFLMYAFRGVSRVKPVEHHYALVETAESGSDLCSIYWDAWRPHVQTASGAWGVGYAMLEEQVSSSGAYTTATENNLVTPQYTYAINEKELTNGHVYGWVAEHRAGTLANETGTYSDGTHGVRGFTATNLTWQEVTASADTDRYEFYDYGGARQKYLTATIDAVAGDDVCFAVNLKTYLSVFSADYEGVMVLADPSANTYGISLNNGYFKAEWDGNFGSRPDYWWAAGNSTTNGTALYGIGLVAPETGTYTATLYLTKESDTLSWSTGSNPATLYQLRTRVNAAGLSLNQPPFLSANSAASAVPFSNDGYVPPALLKRDETTTWNSHTTISVGMLEVLPADTTLRPVRLRATPEAGYFKFDDADHLAMSATDQPYGFFPDAQLYADQCVHPTYRLTEGGADNDGKYYWEVTVDETTSAANVVGGVVPSGYPLGTIRTNPQDSPYNDNFLASVQGDGHVEQSGISIHDFGSMTAGDVFGFALNIPAGTCAVYKNGVLLATADNSDCNVPNQLLHCAYRFVWFFTDTVTSLVPITANFRGPFVYSKPAGYVAYDYMNEQA